MQNVDSEMGWGTWNPDLPAELSHLSSGFKLTPTIYSARGNSFSTITSNTGFTFGPRSLDGRTIKFSTEHFDTCLDWHYQLGDDATQNGDVQLEWHSRSHGEWGLRFWVCLCVSGPPGTEFIFDKEKGVLTGTAPSTDQLLIIQSAKAPLMATFHQDLNALRDEMHEHGYFYLASRGTEGHFAVLRYNLEEAPAMRISVRLNTESKSVNHSAAPELPIANDHTEPTTEHDPAQRSLMAIHDVVSWNHVFDTINKRPYTVLTRNWNTHKFGGFGVWMNDIIYNALMWSLFDTQKAKQNIEAVFAWQTPEGNFPCLITGNDAWLDRSQPPIVSYVIWVLYQRNQDTRFLQWAFDHLLKNHDWWWRCRELDNSGLVAYGTSLEVGDGLYKGTKLAAKDESSMDNMPVHDPAPFNPQTGMLESFDVGLNSLLALDAEVLAQMAMQLNQHEEANRLSERCEQHKQRIATHLWDDVRGVFANRLLTGEFVESLAPTSFYPLAAGIGNEQQRRSLINNYLKNDKKFAGTFYLPSCTRDDPAYHDNVYWRGRIWAPLNYWVYLGLNRCGENKAAMALAESSFMLFEKSWQQRLCGENYNADTGEVLDQADTDGFYSWGALLPMIKLSSVIDVTPWSGLSIHLDNLDSSVGPVRSPLGELQLHKKSDCWEILRDGKRWLRGNLKGSLTHIQDTENSISFYLTNNAEPGWLEWADKQVPEASLEGKALVIDNGRIQVPVGLAEGKLSARTNSNSTN